MNNPQTESDAAINLESQCFDELDRDTTPRSDADPADAAPADLPSPGPQAPRSKPPARELRHDCFPADLA